MSRHSISAERWEQIKNVFHAALELEGAERASYLDREYGNDIELRQQVSSLLDSHENATDFMETPAVALVGDIGKLRGASYELPAQDERIGAYRLIREVGRGGMGTVYLATRDDGQFSQRVAIKVIKRGMDTDAIVARFRQERQIVAALEHPNIARLLDGGTTHDGLPYFVMEYVEGQSIRDYCASRNLNVRERLQLFRTVCSAVQLAHQNLVVHRDIKSSNIIVTNDGVPKLLDFGIAKVLQSTANDTQPLHTETVGAMTPEYASPEQLRGEHVTTATDVYSLGVLLYELLTGQRPFEAQSLRGEALIRLVSTTDPPLPSALLADSPVTVAVSTQQLRGDLDTVVLMAIRRESVRRYSSVERFSDDIARYLENRPVVAQRDTFQYRARKYIERNSAALSVAALVLITVLGGLGATLWQARVAETERVRAERRFEEIRSLATAFLFDVHDAVVELEGATPVRAMLVNRAVSSLDGLMKESAGDTLLERELSMAYQRLGLVQGNSYNANLGDTKAALASYQTAVQLVARSTDTTSRSVKALTAYSLAHRGLADMQVVTGDLKAAVANLELSRAAIARAVWLDSANIELHRTLADVNYVLGDTYGGFGMSNVGDTKRSLASYRTAVAIREQMLTRLPKDEEVLGGLANTLQHLGSLELSLDDSTGSAHLARSVKILEDITNASPDDAVRKNNLLAGYLRQRRPLADAGRFDEAMIADRKVLGMLLDMVKADPTNALLQRNLGVTYNTLGFDLVGAGRASEAVVEHQRALDIASTLAIKDAASLEMKRVLRIHTTRWATRCAKPGSSLHQSNNTLAHSRSSSSWKSANRKTRVIRPTSFLFMEAAAHLTRRPGRSVLQNEIMSLQFPLRNASLQNLMPAAERAILSRCCMAASGICMRVRQRRQLLRLYASKRAWRLASGLIAASTRGRSCLTSARLPVPIADNLLTSNQN